MHDIKIYHFNHFIYFLKTEVELIHNVVILTIFK